MRCSRTRFAFGLGIVSGSEQAEGEVTTETKRKRAAHRRGEADFQQAAEDVRLTQAVFMELGRRADRRIRALEVRGR